MKLSLAQTPSSSPTSTSPRYNRRRKKYFSKESSSYEEIEDSPTQSSHPEDFTDDQEADDEYEEQTQYDAYNDSITLANSPESTRACNSDATQPVPQIAAYVNVAPLPIFRGRHGECPVTHLCRFARVCRANNASSTDTMMRIFPVTLDDEAALWYELNIEPNPSLDWDEIKYMFLQAYRRVEFVDQLRSELMTIRQGEGESVNAFHMRMQWILKRWPDHGIPDSMLKGIFLDGLREDFQDWIFPQRPNSLVDALKLAMTWEQTQIIRAARRRKVIAPVGEGGVKCGFCDGAHEEGRCEIREKMKDVWMKMAKVGMGSSSLSAGKVGEGLCGRNKDFRSISLATSIMRRQGEGEGEGEGGEEKERSQCQCWKHQCWKKTGKRNSLDLKGEATPN